MELSIAGAAVPARCSASWKPSRITTLTNIFRWTRCATLRPRRRFRFARLQRRHFLRSVQSPAARRQHHLHLPRHRLPHPRFPQPAAERSPGAQTWAGGSERQRRRRQDLAHHARPEIYGAHGGLLWAVRHGAGGRSESSHLRACERAHSGTRNPNDSERRSERCLESRTLELSVQSAKPGWPSFFPPFPGSRSAWELAAAAMAPRGCSTPLPKPSSAAEWKSC